jgi:MFS family permease
MMTSVLIALLIGYITNRMVCLRKHILHVSGFLMAILCICLVFIHILSQALVLSAAYGLCYGTYYVLSMSILLDVLPDKENSGKDIGVWHIALNVPQIFAAPLAGLLLDM